MSYVRIFNWTNLLGCHTYMRAYFKLYFHQRTQHMSHIHIGVSLDIKTSVHISRCTCFQVLHFTTYWEKFNNPLFDSLVLMPERSYFRLLSISFKRSAHQFQHELALCYFTNLSSTLLETTRRTPKFRFRHILRITGPVSDNDLLFHLYKCLCSVTCSTVSYAKSRSRHWIILLSYLWFIQFVHK